MLVLVVELAGDYRFYYNAVVENETIIDDKFITLLLKNGLGPSPIKNDKGWLQLAWS
jgi:hypothetical protein